MARVTARATVEMVDDLAAAFNLEMAARAGRGERISAAELARRLMAEALRAKGYSIDEVVSNWGGRR